MLSIIIPIYNEAENLPVLYEKITATMAQIARPYEVVLVNDGSADGSAAVLEDLARRDPRLKVVNFRRNFGQTAAMMAGIDYATGDTIIPMDADLQNDPADIVHLLAKLDEGYDVVSGWRKDRQDHAVKRNLPSRMANALISKISGIHLHDYGCSLKAYRRDVIKGVRLYGEMHRFIPIYASWQGAKVTEIPVTHHPRLHGKSKYGLERVFKVLLDLIVVKFLSSYANKPIYLFGGVGFFALFLAGLAGIWAVYLKLFRDVSFIETPLPLLVVMMGLTGVTSILMGLLAELIMRTYYESQSKQVYLVGKTLNIDPEK